MKKFLYLIGIYFISLINTNAQCELIPVNIYQYSCDFTSAFYFDNSNTDLEYNANVLLWDFGNGSTVVDGFATQYTFDEPGTYSISITILEGACEGVQYDFDFTVSECNCPSDITYEIPEFSYSQCSEYQINLVGDDFSFWTDQDYTILWDFGDGNIDTQSWGTSAYHAFESEGEHIITATFTNDLCTTTLTDTINVEFCEQNCVPFEYFFYDQTPGNCSEVFLVLDYSQDLQWFVDGIYVGQGYAVTVVNIEPGAHDICMVIEQGVGCPYGSEECIEIIIECEDECPTEEDFYSATINGSCNNWEFEIGDYVSGTTIEWNFGDGQNATSANYVQHQYSESGVYVVEAFYYSLDCPDGVEFIQTIVVEECEECWIEVSYNVQNCEYYNFIAESNDNSSITWYYDGLNIGEGNTIDIPFPTEGEHTICAISESNFCITEWCESFDIDYSDCNENCWIEVYETVNDCEVWLGSYTNEGDSGYVEWYIDGLYYSAENSINLNFAENGTHYYCASYYPENCDYVTEVCGEFYIEICGEGSCPTENDFYASPITGSNCNYWEFEIGSYQSGETATWNFGDGVIESGGHYITHEYAEPGIYVVSVFYFSLECPDGFEMIYTILVEDCEFDCYLELDYANQSCNEFTFISYTNPEDENATISWLIDEEYMGDGQFFDFTFETEGWHTICAMSESGLCFLDQCTEIFVDFSECECTDVNFSIDSDIDEGGPGAINWMIFSYDYGTVIETGVCTYELDNPFCDTSICLEDGCYQMVLYIGEGTDWTGISSFPFIGDEQLDIFNISSSCDCGIITYDFSINSDCQEDCLLDVFVDEINPNVFNFTSNAPVDAVVVWYMGDGGIITDGNPQNYSYDEPGTYTICASYQNENCPLGVEDCVTVIVEETICTEVLITISADVSSGEIELLQFILTSEGFEIEGEFPITELSGSIGLLYCIPNGCYDFVLIPSDGLFDLIDLSITATIDGIEIASLEDIIGTEEVVLTIPINDTSCTSSIDNLSTLAFSMYPNPSTGSVTINTTQISGNAQIELYNSIGKLIYVQELTNNRETIDLQNLSSGLYQVNIIHEGQISTQKLLIEK